MFVGYQLLRAISELQRRGVSAGDLRLSDVWVDSTLWLRLRPRLSGSLCPAPPSSPERARTEREELGRRPETERRGREAEGRSGPEREQGGEAERRREGVEEDVLQSLSLLTQVGDMGAGPGLCWDTG